MLLGNMVKFSLISSFLLHLSLYMILSVPLVEDIQETVTEDEVTVLLSNMKLVGAEGVPMMKINMNKQKLSSHIVVVKQHCKTT